MQPNYFHSHINYKIIKKESQILAVQDRYFNANGMSKYDQVSLHMTPGGSDGF